MLTQLPVREEVKDPENFNNLKKKVSELLDFDCSKYTDTFLGRRFFVRLRKHNINSYSEYLQILNTDKTEWEALKTELTIHVTHLFRDKDFWDAFRDEVIDLMISYKDQRKDNSIEIWSAGCSSGEEPVSIAISFLEKLGPKIGKYRITIIGTDYDHEIVNKAMNPSYEEGQFRETDEKIKEKYFIKNPQGTYTPNPQVRSLICYKQEDMLSTTLKNVDTIFCRNVVIYFEREAKKQLYNKFYEALNPGGFLILGKTEYLDGEAREKLKSINMKERIYRKPE
jgi:chemotaxis protein methyltransferase CheR